MEFQLYLQHSSPLTFLQITLGIIGKQDLYSNENKQNLSAVLGLQSNSLRRTPTCFSSVHLLFWYSTSNYTENSLVTDSVNACFLKNSEI
jgi:hypothetical protein